jgi:hypothetical protein
MPVAGVKPKADRSQIRHRNQPAQEWTEVADVPFEGAPALRARSAGGLSVMAVGAANSEDWPQATVDWWADISRMPHCKLWTAAEWRFAMDTAEIHARTMEAWRGYTGGEVRAREKLMGTLADYRRDLRIRYVKPEAAEQAAPAGVTQLDDYRNL